MSGAKMYETKYNTFNRGIEYQEHIADILGLVNYHTKKEQYNIGENRLGLEIKFDTRCTDMGHLWIETAEKSNWRNERWIPSGIYRDDNSWLYAQGNWQKIWIFLKIDLIKTDKDNSFERWAFPWGEKATGTGYVLKFTLADELAKRIIDVQSNKILKNGLEGYFS